MSRTEPEKSGFAKTGQSLRQIICVEDQAEVRELLTDIFQARGKEVFAFAAAEPALSHLRAHWQRVGLVVLDLDLGPGQPHGLEVLRQINADYPDLPTIILTGKGTIEMAVSAVKVGASDFIEKDPYLEEKLELSVGKIERMLDVLGEREQLAATNRALRAQVDRLQRGKGGGDQIVGHSKALTAVLEKVVRVAPLPRPVLILGERGTGKELVAHAIHRSSPRANAPFVVMNCAAVPETLLESELFGHEKGAFTGATQRKLGKFELADGGTLFLDEIGNMSLEFQMRILRVLEYQRFQRVAGTREIVVDVRVIAATNADLRAKIQRGEFRADLYDRLAFEVVLLPPLRQRKEDISPLARHFIDRFRAEVGGVRCKDIAPDALAVLCAYGFDGNIRELKNIVERAAYGCESDRMTGDDIRQALPGAGTRSPAHTDAGFVDRVESLEREMLLSALGQHGWNQRDAAKALHLTYDQLRHLYRKYQLARLKPE